MNHHPSQMQGNPMQPPSNHMNPNAGPTMNNTNTMAHHHQHGHGMPPGPPMYDHMLQPNPMNGMQKGPSEFIYLNQQHPHHLNQQLAAQNQYLQSRNNVS
jgi:hypothetical protein